MAKTLDDVKAALEKVEGGNELLEVVTASRLEAENIRKGFNTLQSKYDRMISEAKVLGYDGGDFSAFTNQVKEKIEKAKEPEQKLTAAEKELLTLKSTVASLAEKANKFESSYKGAIIKDKLSSMLSGKIYAADAHLRAIISDGRAVLSDDNKTVLWKKGDELVPVDTGLAEYMAENKADLINKTQPGPGGAPRSNPNGGGKTISMSEFQSLPEKQKHEFVKSGGEII